MNKPTPYQLSKLKDIWSRQNDLPVGISLSAFIAKKLVSKGLVEYAPCSYLHLLKSPIKLSSVRCTTVGQLYAEGKM